MTRVCDYPPCSNEATIPVPLAHGTGYLCVGHALRADALWQRLTDMDDEEYAAYIEDLLIRAQVPEDGRDHVRKLLLTRREDPREPDS